MGTHSGAGCGRLQGKVDFVFARRGQTFFLFCRGCFFARKCRFFTLFVGEGRFLFAVFEGEGGIFCLSSSRSFFVAVFATECCFFTLPTGGWSILFFAFLKGRVGFFLTCSGSFFCCFFGIRMVILYSICQGRWIFSFSVSAEVFSIFYQEKGIKIS